MQTEQRDSASLVQERGIRRSRTKNQRLVVGIMVAVLAALVVGAWLALRPKPDTFVLSNWTEASVQRKDLRETLEVSGTMDVEQEEDVVALQPGLLSAVSVGIGDKVKRGQTLARITSTNLEDQLAQALSTLDKTKRDLDRLTVDNRYTLAKFDRERPALQRAVDQAAQSTEVTRRLVGINGASRHDLDAAIDRETAAEEALAASDSDRAQAVEVYGLSQKNMEADIELLTASVKRLRENLAECNVVAPYDSTIMDLYSQLGAFVSQYQKLCHVADTSHPRAVLDVPEDSVGALHVGQAVAVLGGSGTYPAAIERIGLEAEANSSNATPTVPIYVSFTGQPPTVIPGSTATGEIDVGTKKGTLVLPRGAFLSTGSQLYAYVIHGRKAVKTQVTYGLILPTEVEILSGLREGDRVITSGYQDFIDKPEIGLKGRGVG